MIRCRIGCSVLVAAALLCAACGGGPGSATPETASSQAQAVEAAGSLQPSSTVAVPVVEAAGSLQPSSTVAVPVVEAAGSLRPFSTVAVPVVEAAGSLRPFSTVAVPVVEAAGSLRPFSTVAVPVVEAPVLELGELEVGFFAYGEGGDESTAAMAGVRIAIIDDPDAWWRALRDDAPDFWEGLPPGYRVKISPERLETAPARFVVTADDGTAVAPVDAGRDYLYCAIAPEADDLIAGCSERQDTSNMYSVFFSSGRAYFVSGRDDLRDGSSHYSNFVAPGHRQPDQVRVTFVSLLFLDFSDEDHPEGVTFGRGDPFAIIDDADVGSWWSVVSQGHDLALSVSFEYSDMGQSIYTAAEWSGSFVDTDPGLRPFQRPSYMQVSQQDFDAAPAQYIITGAGGTAEAHLTAGHYIFCGVRFDTARRKGMGSASITDCIHEDVTGPHDTVIEYSASEATHGIKELSRADGARVLEQARRHINQ